jgi:hypothetical protein
MADTFEVMFGEPAEPASPEFYDLVSSVEVEENADLPGAVQITMPIAVEGAPGFEDVTLVGDDRFKPYARIAVVATPEGQSGARIFDGHVLSHRIHLDPGTAATLQVWGQDASCLMNLTEVVKPWNEKTDGEAANEIFDQYGFAHPEANLQDDSPKHTEGRHALMQRATDAQFLRDRALRGGKLFRVCFDDVTGRNTGYFIKPDLTATPTVTLTLNPQPPEAANVKALVFEWDVARPTQVFANVLVDRKDAEKGDASDSGLQPLDSRSLADFTGSDHVMQARLTTAAGSAEELKQRAAALLREAGWFVRCEGETDLARLKALLRVGTIAQIDGAGQLHSGNYFVWSVRHTITAECHRMRFVLVRNAVGAA